MSDKINGIIMLGNYKATDKMTTGFHLHNIGISTLLISIQC